MTKRKGQKRQDSFATLATRMDRVSTRVNLYRMSPFPGSEQVATNVSANILLLEERQPTGLGDSNRSIAGVALSSPFH
jgi:hypothetical protein